MDQFTNVALEEGRNGAEEGDIHIGVALDSSGEGQFNPPPAELTRGRKGK